MSQTKSKCNHEFVITNPILKPLLEWCPKCGCMKIPFTKGGNN